MTVEHRLRIGDRDVLLIEGPAGWGECSPLPGYPCEFATARAAAEEAATLGWPPAVRSVVSVNGFVPATASLADGAESEAWLGFPSVKVKVGRMTPDVDVERVARVRELIGPTVGLRVDANGAWDVETAVATLARLVSYDLEFAEQPVARLDDLAAVRRRVTMPIAADECVRGVADARRLQALAAADIVVLKVQPLGGVRAALAVADAAGVPAVVTSMYETSIGLAAGLALAAALPMLPFACGLATLGEIAGDVTATPLRPHGGVLTIDAAFPPQPSSALLARYAVAA